MAEENVNFEIVGHDVNFKRHSKASSLNWPDIFLNLNFLLKAGY